MNAEATRLPRVPFTRPLSIAPKKGDGPRRRLYADNLSAGGMFVLAREPYSIGMKLEIELESSHGAFPLGEAEVVWKGVSTLGAAGFGIRFIQLLPNAKVLVDSLLKHGGSGRKEPRVLSEEPPTPAFHLKTPGGGNGGSR